MRISKMMGVAVVAVLALAVSASAASAATFNVEGTTGPFTVKAEQKESENHVFTIEGGLTTKCKKATFEGSQAGTSATTLTVTPVYNECTAFGLSATVNMNGCKYEFPAPAGSGTPNSGPVKIVGCGGNKATITTATCEVQVGEQENESVSYNSGGGTPATVEISANVSKLKYNKTKDGFLCPLNGTGEKEDGTYTGSTISKGFEGATQRAINVM